MIRPPVRCFSHSHSHTHTLSLLLSPSPFLSLSLSLSLLYSFSLALARAQSLSLLPSPSPFQACVQAGLIKSILLRSLYSALPSACMHVCIEGGVHCPPFVALASSPLLPSCALIRSDLCLDTVKIIHRAQSSSTGGLLPSCENVSSRFFFADVTFWRENKEVEEKDWKKKKIDRKDIEKIHHRGHYVRADPPSSGVRLLASFA